MHSHEKLLRTFYAALAAGDAGAMARCYHADVFYSDPVFPRLHGREAADAWRMRLARAEDLEVELAEAHADGDGGRARWTARYAFGRGGRRVVNRVESLFAFRDGLIARQFDHFPFWRWAGQAFGPAGAALGWLPLFKWKVRKDAARALERFRDGDAG